MKLYLRIILSLKTLECQSSFRKNHVEDVSEIEKVTELCCEEIGCFALNGIYTLMKTPICPEMLGIRFKLYTWKNKDQAEIITRRDSADIPREFQMKWQATPGRLIFVIHGYMMSANDESILQIKRKLLDTVSMFK